MSRLQNEDHKSLTQLTAAGGSASQLLNDSKVYVTANSINKQLSQAIIDGDIGGAAGGPVNLILNPTADVNTTGWATYNDTETATMTIASPAVVTVPSTTGYYAGLPFCFTTTGALPTGVTAGTTYYVTTVVSGTTFRFSATLGGADVNTTGSQSGVHTFRPLNPINGTGGTANVTWTRTTTNPLRGAGSFLLTKDAVNRAGEGVSYDFTVPLAFRAQVLQAQIESIVVSGTFAAGGGTTSSDVQIWAYDVTNSVLVQLTTFKIFGNSTAVSNNFMSNFQSTASGSTFRLIFHVSTNSASAYTVAFDDVTVSPTTYSYGTPITDWQAYTPTFTGFGTVTNIQFHSKRDGSDLLIRGKATTGTTTAVEARVSLPSGLISGDTTLIPSIQNAGGLFFYAANGALAIVSLIEPSVSYLTFGLQTGSSQGLVKANANSLIGSSLDFTFFARVPIQGWSAQIQSSDVNDQRIVEADYAVLTGTSATVNNQINFDSVIKDTHAAVTTGSSWKFTSPVTGSYEVSVTGAAAGSNTLIWNLFKNGSFYRAILTTYGNAGTGSVNSGSCRVELNAGDYIDVRLASNASNYTIVAGNNGTGSTISNTNFINIKKIANPASITSTETVSARYSAAVGNTNTAAGAIGYNTKVWDSHNAVTVGSGITGTGWKFTAPVSGLYDVNSMIFLGAGGGKEIRIYKNGSVEQYLYYHPSGIPSMGSGTVRLLAGEYISVNSDVAATVTVTAIGSDFNITITKVGNYIG